MELKKYKLGEFIENYGDGIHGTPKYDTNGDYYFINGNNLLDGKITINDNTLKVSENEYQKIYRPIINGRTILISINGTLGRLAIYRGEKICLGKSACYINLKDSKYISFILYVLKSKEFSIYMNRVAGQSTIKNVSPKQIINYEFFAPKSLENCLNFGNLLSALDEKIELNRKINDNLEAMAKQLYDYWFVQFDFPNEEDKPYKSSGGKMVWNEKLKREIPEGWEVKDIKTFAEVKRGSTITKAQTSEGNIKVISAGTSYSFLHNEANRSAYIITVSASGANAGFINFWREPIYASDCSTIQCSKIEETLYCYYWILYFQELLFTQQIGAAQPHVYPEHINKIPIVIPPIEIFNKIKNELISINKQQRILIKQIENLTKQRDELLPLLMNGQVSVN